MDWKNWLYQALLAIVVVVVVLAFLRVLSARTGGFDPVDKLAKPFYPPPRSPMQMQSDDASMMS